MLLAEGFAGRADSGDRVDGVVVWAASHCSNGAGSSMTNSRSAHEPTALTLAGLAAEPQITINSRCQALILEFAS